MASEMTLMKLGSAAGGGQTGS